MFASNENYDSPKVLLLVGESPEDCVIGSDFDVLSSVLDGLCQHTGFKWVD